jgi:hypothetical protein
MGCLLQLIVLWMMFYCIWKGDCCFALILFLIFISVDPPRSNSGRTQG